MTMNALLYLLWKLFGTAFISWLGAHWPFGP
jgi:hypothetical protein